MKNLINSARQRVMNYIKIRGLYKTINSGISEVDKTGKTPVEAYNAMRKLYVITNGASNEKLNQKLRTPGYQNIPWDKGVLNFKSEADFKGAVQSMKENGFYIFDAKLSTEDVNAIREFAAGAPCTYRKYDEASGKTLAMKMENGVRDLNPADVTWPRYDLPLEEIPKSRKIQELIFDTSILAFAQEYLETKPILDLMAMWWSYPFAGQMKSEAAQMYHFDLDRLKFLKFFFYLTDVDAETGPHCYVRGSHKKLHYSIKRDGRYSDEEIAKAYGADNLLELVGKAGTIMAVDTIGMHKGKDLMRGNRLAFDIEYANHMFGNTYPPAPKPQLERPLEEVYRKYEYTYNKIFI
jgi:hypothetical protein